MLQEPGVELEAENLGRSIPKQHSEAGHHRSNQLQQQRVSNEGSDLVISRAHMKPHYTAGD